MKAQRPSSHTQILRSVTPTFLSGPWGEQWIQSVGSFIDDLSNSMNVANQQRLPTRCATDSLQELIKERNLESSEREPTAYLRNRAAHAHDIWAWSGTLWSCLLPFWAQNLAQLTFSFPPTDSWAPAATDTIKVYATNYIAASEGFVGHHWLIYSPRGTYTDWSYAWYIWDVVSSESGRPAIQSTGVYPDGDYETDSYAPWTYYNLTFNPEPLIREIKTFKPCFLGIPCAYCIVAGTVSGDTYLTDPFAPLFSADSGTWLQGSSYNPDILAIDEEFL